MDEMTKKVQAVMEDREFLESINAMESAAEIQQAFAGKGIDLTIDEINQIGAAVANSGSGELSVSELEEASGGITLEAIAVGAGVVTLVAKGLEAYNKEAKERGWIRIW